MTKLKLFLTEKELLESYMGIKELQELWFTNLLNNKFIDIYEFLKMKINYKYIKNIYSEVFYISADYNSSIRELERAMLKFEKNTKKLELFSRLEILQLNEAIKKWKNL